MTTSGRPRWIKPIAGQSPFGIGGPVGLRLPFSDSRLDPRPRDPLRGQVLARMGSLEARLAGSRDDMRRAQRLRYQVFHQEMGAYQNHLTAISGRDEDAYDPFCEHVIVIDHAHAERRMTSRGLRREPLVVGAYRLLSRSVADRGIGFYSAGEFDIDPLLEREPGLNVLELGRSCVRASHRNKRTIELLWQAVWTYVRAHKIDVMMGCASFEGTDPDRHARPLTYLHRTALAPQRWRVRARSDRHVSMDRCDGLIDPRAVLRDMPPLVKAYLRLGAHVGDGAVVDHEFGTTDVFVILRVERIDPRYFERFGQPDALDSKPVVLT